MILYVHISMTLKCTLPVPLEFVYTSQNAWIEREVGVEDESFMHIKVKIGFLKFC